MISVQEFENYVGAKSVCARTWNTQISRNWCYNLCTIGFIQGYRLRVVLSIFSSIWITCNVDLY